jgi:hypothetical protein
MDAQRPPCRSHSLLNSGMLRGILLFFSTVIMLACTAPHSPAVEQPNSPPLEQPKQVSQSPSASTLRLIIKFKSQGADADPVAQLQRLSADVGVPLEYIRPVFGGAHVVVTGEALSAEEKSKLLKRLSSHKDVEYAEEDAMMHKMIGQ